MPKMFLSEWTEKFITKGEPDDARGKEKTERREKRGKKREKDVVGSVNEETMYLSKETYVVGVRK